MTGAIGALLLFESAVTLDEFRKAKLRDGVTVHDHKTARSGPARLTLSQELKGRVDEYVNVLRPLCDPFDNVNKLLTVPVGKEVMNLNNLMTRVARHYGIYVPTATQLRKKTATACALHGTKTEPYSVRQCLMQWRRTSDTTRRSAPPHMQLKLTRWQRR